MNLPSIKLSPFSFPRVSILRKNFSFVTVLLQFSRHIYRMFISSISEILLAFFSYYVEIYLAILVIESNEITGFSIFDYVLLRFGCTAVHNAAVFFFFYMSCIIFCYLRLIYCAGLVQFG